MWLTTTVFNVTPSVYPPTSISHLIITCTVYMVWRSQCDQQVSFNSFVILFTFVLLTTTDQNIRSSFFLLYQIPVKSVKFWRCPISRDTCESVRYDIFTVISPQSGHVAYEKCLPSWWLTDQCDALWLGWPKIDFVQDVKMLETRAWPLGFQST